MKKLTTKLSVIAAVGLVAVLPAPASAASGSIACPPDERVYTFAEGTGWYHYHTLNGTQYRFDMPDGTNINRSTGYWNVRTGNWETHTSGTTTLSGAGCYY